MRKILIMLLIVILIVGLVLILTSGVVIGKFEIPSINKIIEENRNMDRQISNLETAISSDYTSATSSLETSFQKLQTSKKKYQDAITYSTEEEIKAANQTEKYEIGYLWTKMGIYATNNNVTMQATVSSGTIQGLYNISFTATGEYISISEFIYNIEKDTSLGFKIEDFTMSPYSESNLQATFVIRNVPIDEASLTAVTANANNEADI